ncbi:MAG: Verru_Chthon cassette protein C [Verrucomicrobiota bacterium]|nr:Verru_Chthon cassette protein C [Verrucomicrobiota bacterium]
MKSRTHAAFTLVELVVSLAIISMLALVLVAMTGQTSEVWGRARSKIDQFRGAREGFESMTRRLSQATLNTYLEYYNANGVTRNVQNSKSFEPKSYGRFSELRFISGPNDKLLEGSTAPRPTHGIFFQAPLGFVEDYEQFGALDNLLNTWGYFVEFNSDVESAPRFLRGQISSGALPERKRYRLMELMQPSETMLVYREAESHKWFQLPVLATTDRPVRPIADNIVALVILPRLAPNDTDPADASGNTIVPEHALAPEFEYDSTTDGEGTVDAKAHLNTKHQLPPVVQVSMVAVDEASASRLADRFKNEPPDLKIDSPRQLFRKADQLKVPPSEGELSDLQTLEKNLVDLKCNYRVFTTAVSLKGAKWSRTIPFRRPL